MFLEGDDKNLKAISGTANLSIGNLPSVLQS
jgi:hypothetical protein